jgi:hypothetical protein
MLYACALLRQYADVLLYETLDPELVPHRGPSMAQLPPPWLFPVLSNQITHTLHCCKIAGRVTVINGGPLTLPNRILWKVVTQNWRM